MRKYTTLSIILFLVTNTAYAFMTGVDPEKDGGAALEIITGVIHMSPPASKVNAGYGTLRNNTAKDITLSAFKSPVFDNTEVHMMEYSANGTAKMKELMQLVIPANGEVVLESGGLHLMFIGKRRDLTLNEEILVIAQDNLQVRYMLNMKVIDSRVDNNHDHHMH